MFHIHWLTPAPPKPFYYKMMNPEEQVLWAIIGEQRTTSYVDKRGNLRAKSLSRAERARNQKLFFDTRAGKAIVGDDWMRMNVRDYSSSSTSERGRGKSASGRSGGGSGKSSRS